MQEILAVPERQRKPDVEHHRLSGILNDRGSALTHHGHRTCFFRYTATHMIFLDLSCAAPATGPQLKHCDGATAEGLSETTYEN
ncbi:MAG: hypothetical protein ACK4MS_13570 [Paracoccaceae bacterium]